jgi:hypothetical protein
MTPPGVHSGLAQAMQVELVTHTKRFKGLRTQLAPLPVAAWIAVWALGLPLVLLLGAGLSSQQKDEI